MYEIKKHHKQIDIVFAQFKPHGRKIIFIFFLGVIALLCDVLAPLPFKLLIDNVLNQLPIEEGTFGKEFFEQFSPLTLGYVSVIMYAGFNIFASALSFLVSTETKQTVKNITNQCARKTFEIIERMRHSSYDEKDIGDYIYRISSNVPALGALLEEGVFPALHNTLFIIATACVLFFINPTFTTLVLLVIPVIAGILFIFDKHLNRAWRKTERSNSLIFSFVEEILTQLKNVQAFNQEGHILSIFQKKESRALTYEFKAYHLYFVLHLCIGVFIAFAYAGVITYGISLVFADIMSAGALILFLFYFDNLVNPCVSVMTAVTSMREQWVKLKSVYEITEQEQSLPPIVRHSKKMPPSPDITFDHVTITGMNDVVILHNVSFHIPKNAITVLVGANGGGKTTITSTLMGFFDVAKGRVSFDDTDITTLPVSRLRDMIAYVPQESVLFNTTIKENIAFGNPYASMRDIHAAARLACAHDFIMKKQGGYHYHVGEHGGRLSGGQRQRILIARALLKRSAPIVIMDEPFSSQDVHMHRALIKSVQQFSKQKTVLIVTNTLDVIQIAQHVIMVNQGRVIAQGGHEKLLQQKRLAKLLVALR